MNVADDVVAGVEAADESVNAAHGGRRIGGQVFVATEQDARVAGQIQVEVEPAAGPPEQGRGVVGVHVFAEEAAQGGARLVGAMLRAPVVGVVAQKRPQVIQAVVRAECLKVGRGHVLIVAILPQDARAGEGGQQFMDAL